MKELAWWVLVLSFLFSWLVASLYLGWALTRSVRRRRVNLNLSDVQSMRMRRILAGDGDVKFEAVWGMVLAPPILAIGLVGLTDSEMPAWLGIVGLAGVTTYSVAALALLSIPLPWWARVWPAVVAFAATPVLAFSGVLAPDELMGGLVLASRFGVGYVADCVVGVRFALAVGRRDRATTPASEIAELLAAPKGTADV